MEKKMVTKKKTKAEIVIEENWPKVVKGSHLTVTTHSDGRTELVWDDAALERDVRDAIRAYESTNLVGALALGKKPVTKIRKKSIQ